MDRDHIIRIVLEGKNNLSNVVRDMARNVDVEFRRMRNQWKEIDNEAARYARTMKSEVNDAHRRSAELMGALRQRADALSASLRRLRGEQEARNRATKEEIVLFGGGRGRRGEGGRFERVPTTRDRLGSTLDSARELLRGVAQGTRAAAEIRRQLREQLKLGEDQIETRKAQLRDFEKFQKAQIAEMIDFEKEETEKAIDEINRKKIELDLKRAQELKGIEDRVIREQVRLRVQGEKDVLDAEIRERRRQRTRRIKEIKDEAAEELRARKAAISPIDEAAVTERVLRESTSAIRENESAMRRLGHTAGRSLGDIGRGFLDGRRGLRALTIEGQRADSIFARLGNTIGRATRSLGTLVNLRWFILISALSLFGSLIAVIGSNLVSLASSATLAAAALGGAFTAALGQGIAIMGLFKAAAASLGTVLDAVKIQEQERLRAGDDAAQKAEDQRTAVQRLADANWNLKLALEGVTDAQDAVKDAEDDRVDAVRDQRRAVLDLAEARRDAARAIVDANLEERDAALSLEEAELAVLEAKRKLREEQNKSVADRTDLADARAAVQEAQERLRIARAEGDQVEIGVALSQLAQAEQNLGAIQNQIEEAEDGLEQAQNAVRRAELNQQQAAIRNQRAQQDAAEARKKGVEGSDEVINAREQLRESNERVADATDRIAQALRGVRDAVHAVAIARREQRDAELGVTEAVNKQTAAQEDLQNRLADMSPAERKLFNSLVRIRRIYEDNFGSITDIIIGAYQRAVDRAAILLQDPKILAAAKRLAQAIASAIDTISRFTLSPEFRRALITFLDEAAKNVPLLTRAFLALLRVFLRLGTAGAPLFRNLLERFVGMVERLEKATRDPSRLEKFFAGARRHLDAWIELGKAIGGVVGALIPQAATAAVDRPGTDRALPGETRPGINRPLPQAQGTQGILPFFTDKLRDAEKFFEDNPESVTKFFDNMNKSLQNLAPVLGRTVAFLFQVFTSEEAAAFSKIILEVVIPGLASLIKVLGVLSRALLFILDIPIVGDIAKFALSFLVFEKALNKIFPVSQKLTEGLKALSGAIVKGLVTSIKQASLRPFVTLFDGIRLRAMYARDAIGLLMTRLRAMAVLLAGRISAAVRTFALLVRTNIRLIIGATGIGLLLVAIGLIYEHWDKIGPRVKKVFDAVRKAIGNFIDWLRNNWKLVAAIIIGIFTFPVGPIAIAIYKFRDRIIGVFKAIGVAFRNAFVDAIAWVREKVTGFVDWITKKLKGIPLIGGLFKEGGEVEDTTSLESKTVKPGISRHAGGTVPGGEGAAVPIIAHAGEWVLNKGQQGKLLKKLNMAADEAKSWLFGGARGEGGGAPRGAGRNRQSFRGNFFTLTEQIDDDGNSVWFIEMDDGAWGQISKRSAERIKATNGNWIPPHVRRSTHGFTNRPIPPQIGRGLAMGGVVQRFALGGIVQDSTAGEAVSGAAITTRPGQTIQKSVTQAFNVKAEGTMDWHYIMRLGAQRAQEV